MMKKLLLFLLIMANSQASELYSDAYLIQDVNDRTNNSEHSVHLSQSLNHDIYNITSIGYTYDYYLNHFLSISPEIQIHRREMKASHKAIVSLIEKSPNIISYNPDFSTGGRLNFLPISGVGNFLNSKELGMSLGTALGISLDKYKEFISPGGYFGLNINFETSARRYSLELRQTTRMNNDYFDHYTSLNLSIGLF